MIVTDIEIVYRQITCSICGACDQCRWGIPVDSETAQIVGNDFEGDWGGVPVCELCHSRHANGEFVGEYPRF